MSGKKQNILIGITGSIAAYKICELIRALKKKDVSVKVILTKAGEQFVTPLTISTLTENRVYKDLFVDDAGAHRDMPLLEHINLSDWADVCVIAPASANTIAKIAHGIADNLLTSTVLALPKEVPLIICPAMNVNMWENKMVRKNMSVVQEIADIVGPKKGRLACGVEGMGAMADVEDIFEVIVKKLRSFNGK
ncbi:MAG: flavoprotein [bacterium]|nr:flavoprotein [bacterium]